MYYINKIALDYDSRNKILTQLPSVPHEPGMSPFDSAFLCGLLKMSKPRKIVEIGVAGGATTAIILQCMEDIAMPYKMYSVDISETVWHTKTLKTGSIADYAKKILSPTHHELLIGAGVTSFLDRIGDDIDFVILDTVHRIPGEILDFLAIFPYLKEGAIVCLHDLMTCQYARISAPETHDYYATNILFNNVKANKYLSFNTSLGKEALPNIGAFQVTGETKQDILSVFFCLLLPWGYIPSDSELNMYSNCILQNYDDILCKIYEQAVSLNIYNMRGVNSLIKILTGKQIALWGAGVRGRVLWKKLMDNGFDVENITWIDKNANRILKVDEKKIVTPAEIDWQNSFDYIVITPSNQSMKEEIRKYLKMQGIADDLILFF